MHIKQSQRLTGEWGKNGTKMNKKCPDKGVKKPQLISTKSVMAGAIKVKCENEYKIVKLHFDLLILRQISFNIFAALNTITNRT